MKNPSKKVIFDIKSKKDKSVLEIKISNNLNILEYHINMLKNNKELFCIYPEVLSKDKVNLFSYDIEGYISLSDYINNKQKKKENVDFFGIIVDINKIIKNIQGYLLNDNSIVLNLKNIYINDNKDINFIYVPVLIETTFEEIYKEFITNFIDAYFKNNVKFKNYFNENKMSFENVEYAFKNLITAGNVDSKEVKIDVQESKEDEDTGIDNKSQKEILKDDNSREDLRIISWLMINQK